ncbi:MAG: metalloregulator ArsR/SmtB family transcription factor [Gemmatimonadota bacterium]|nr:metalloregulator ArsR/SmtB family transcription factor [Gemmatimonadota bacterium]
MVYLARSLDATFGALADPTRRKILLRLARRDETIKALAGQFTMTLPAVSKHVRVLQRAGLLRITRDGRARRTSFVGAPMQQAASWIEQYRPLWEHQFDRLAQYLNATTSGTDAWPLIPPSPHSKSVAPSTPRANASTRRGPRRKNSSAGARRAT